MGGTGEEAFEQCGQRLLLGGFSNDVEQCASNEREIGQEVGVTGTGSVLAHQRITPPMVADFNAAPVSADQLQPLFGVILLGQSARQIITRLGRCAARLFERSLAAQDDQGSGKGEAGSERFQSESMQAADFDAPVAGLDVGKKGVLGNASSPWACLSSLGWLPLTWSR